MEMINRNYDVKKRGEFDVIVAGGGVAGVSAALAVRRAGKSVLLIEKTTLLGGLATIGLVNLFVPMCNGRGKQIIFGMCEEFLRLSAKYGYDSIPAEWKDGEPKAPTNVRYVCRYSPQIFACALTELLIDSGVKIMFDTIVSGVDMNGNICKGIFVENKSGCGYYSAKQFVDTTGECEILARAGMPTFVGKNYFTYYGHFVTLDSCKSAVEKQDIGKLYGGFGGAPADLYGRNQPEDVPYYTGVDAEGVSDYFIRAQKAMLAKLRLTDRKTRDVATLPTMPQFRTTRCMHGDYVFTIRNRYQHFEDSIGAINDFDNRDFLYEVPLRAITRKDYPNLITAGRSASSQGYGWDLLRVIPPAIITGQAAGQIAVNAISEGVGMSQVCISKLQKDLADANVMIHFPDSLVPDKSYRPSDGRDDNGHI